MSAQSSGRGDQSGSLLSREQARGLAERVLGISKADETRVSILNSWSGNTRFADAQITTSGDVVDTSIEVTVTFGKRRASAATNTLDTDGLKRAVDLASRLARLSPDDPESMPELGPQTYSDINAYFERTAALDGQARAAAVKVAVDAAVQEAKAAGAAFVAGFLVVNRNATAVATSRGLFAYHLNADADLSLTVRTPDGTGSGWSHAGGRDWGNVDALTLGRIAAQKAVASRRPQALDPGLYTAVLEPQAVTDLIPLLFGSFNARDADEGRSPFSKRGGGSRIGERITDQRVTLYSDPADSDLLAIPFDAEGLPIGRTVWIEKGVLRNLAYSRYWAAKHGVPPTGRLEGNESPGGLKLIGGNHSTAEVIAGCDRGILITHFFYIRSLERRTALFTGLTRDGAFLVEGGKISRAVKNFRWNESPLSMLDRAEDIGRTEPTAAGVAMPALRIRNFNFASLSDAV